MDIIRSWREQKILLKRRFPILDDNDFIIEGSTRESMMKRLQIKLDKTEKELEALFAELQLY